MSSSSRAFAISVRKRITCTAVLISYSGSFASECDIICRLLPPIALLRKRLSNGMRDMYARVSRDYCSPGLLRKCATGSNDDVGFPIVPLFPTPIFSNLPTIVKETAGAVVGDGKQDCLVFSRCQQGRTIVARSGASRTRTQTRKAGGRRKWTNWDRRCSI